MSSININGGTIGGLQVGNSNKQTITQNMGPTALTAAEFFDGIKTGLPPDLAEDIAAPIIDPLQSIAETVQAEPSSLVHAAAQQESHEQAQSLINRLIPFAPTIASATLAFGEGALKALASSNWVVAGVLSAVQATRARA